MATPRFTLGGANGWPIKEGSVLAYEQTTEGLFKPAPFDVARNSGGSYIAADGSRQIEYRSNVPRITYSGGRACLMNEEARTNLFLNSTTLSTQSVTVANATEYTVSFYGTGTITFSGGHTGSLVGTGVNDRVTATFTTSTTSVTCTVTGSVTEANFELGGYASSWIPTEGAAATRAAESIEGLNLGNFLGDSEGGLYVEAAAFAADSTAKSISISDGSINNSVRIRYNTSNNIAFDPVAGGSTVAVGSTSGVNTTNFNKIFAAYALNDLAFYVGGNSIATGSSFAAYADGTLTATSLSRGGSGEDFRGLIYEIQVFDTRPTNPEMEAQTS